MEDTIKINLRNIVYRPKNSAISRIEIPEDFIELIPRYISIYHGCWLKYISKETTQAFSGGYLICVSESIITLRNIKRDIFELPISDNTFYCKPDTPHHQAVKSIIQEKEKLSSRIQAFNIEKQQFLEKKRQSSYN